MTTLFNNEPANTNANVVRAITEVMGQFKAQLYEFMSKVEGHSQSYRSNSRS